MGAAICSRTRREPAPNLAPDLHDLHTPFSPYSGKELAIWKAEPRRLWTALEAILAFFRIFVLSDSTRDPLQNPTFWETGAKNTGASLDAVCRAQACARTAEVRRRASVAACTPTTRGLHPHNSPSIRSLEYPQSREFPQSPLMFRKRSRVFRSSFRNKVRSALGSSKAADDSSLGSLFQIAPKE